MASLNQVMLIGNLGKDPEVRRANERIATFTQPQADTPSSGAQGTQWKTCAKCGGQYTDSAAEAWGCECGACVEQPQAPLSELALSLDDIASLRPGRCSPDDLTAQGLEYLCDMADAAHTYKAAYDALLTSWAECRQLLSDERAALATERAKLEKAMSVVDVVNKNWHEAEAKLAEALADRDTLTLRLHDAHFEIAASHNALADARAALANEPRP